MRPVVALALSLILAVTLGGCATESTDSPAATTAFDDYLSELRAVPGVTDANIDTSQQQGLARLSITVSPDIEPDDLVEVGDLALDFSDAAQQSNHTAAVPQIVQGESIYAYFRGISRTDVAEQLRYWQELTASGALRVSFTAYESQLAVLDDATAAAAAQATTTTPPRYIRVEFPSASDADQHAALQAVARAKDPGVADGQWGVAGLATDTRVDYPGPNFPGVDVLLADAEVGAEFAEAPGLASVEMRHEQGAEDELNVQVFAFDPALDGLTLSQAEEVFNESTSADMLDRAIVLLEQRGALDYVLRLTSSPVASGENFDVTIRVSGCQFTVDANLPLLRERFAGTWLQHANHERFVGASQICTANGEPIPAH